VSVSKGLSRFTVPLLVFVLLAMIVQNYLLVRKNGVCRERVEKLTWQIMMKSVMAVGDTLPTLAALTLDSTKVSIDASGATRTLFLLFSTRCHICSENWIQWVKLKERMGAEFPIVGLCLDSLYRLRAFGAEHSLAFRTVGLVVDTMTIERYKLSSIPQTILADVGGRVVGVWVGYISDMGIEEIAAKGGVTRK
jgi:hypothetical protein